MQKPSTIELHIEELVLHGFVPSDRYRIGDAVERELAHLLIEKREMMSWSANSEVERVDGGAFYMATGAHADTLGAQVAQSVFRALDGVVK
jgi:hypothetical protein